MANVMDMQCYGPGLTSLFMSQKPLWKPTRADYKAITGIQTLDTTSLTPRTQNDQKISSACKIGSPFSIVYLITNAWNIK